MTALLGPLPAWLGGCGGSLTPAAASPPAATAWRLEPAAFGPLTREVLERVARPPGQGPQTLLATGIRRLWAAPPGQRVGNWEFDVIVGSAGEAGTEAPSASGLLRATSLPATSGPHEDALASEVLPRLAAWATDARRLDAREPGGPAVFASTSRRETLTVYLGPTGGAALVVGWAGRPDDAEATVAPGEGQAIVQAGLSAPILEAEEGRTGLDGFTGLSFRNAEGLPAGCLKLVGKPGLAPRIEPDTPRPLGAPRLVRHLGRLAWRVEEVEPARCLVGPTLDAVYDVGHGPGFIRVHGAAGWVDARTGTLIRLSRSYRVLDVDGV